MVQSTVVCERIVTVLRWYSRQIVRSHACKNVRLHLIISSVKIFRRRRYDWSTKKIHFWGKMRLKLSFQFCCQTASPCQVECSAVKFSIHISQNILSNFWPAWKLCALLILCACYCPHYDVSAIFLSFFSFKSGTVGKNSWTLNSQYTWRTFVRDCWTSVQQTRWKFEIYSSVTKKYKSGLCSEKSRVRGTRRPVRGSVLQLRRLELEHWSIQDQSERNIHRKDRSLLSQATWINSYFSCTPCNWIRICNQSLSSILPCGLKAAPSAAICNFVKH